MAVHEDSPSDISIANFHFTEIHLHMHLHDDRTDITLVL